MEHQIWHDFDPNDRKTHPIANSSVQVKFVNGRRADGVWINGLFFHINVLPESPIAQWRDIKNPATK
jgi:hypothetical protein